MNNPNKKILTRVGVCVCACIHACVRACMRAYERTEYVT